MLEFDFALPIREQLCQLPVEIGEAQVRYGLATGKVNLEQSIIQLLRVLFVVHVEGSEVLLILKPELGFDVADINGESVEEVVPLTLLSSFFLYLNDLFNIVLV